MVIQLSTYPTKSTETYFGSSCTQRPPLIPPSTALRGHQVLFLKELTTRIAMKVMVTEDKVEIVAGEVMIAVMTTVLTTVLTTAKEMALIRA